MKDGVLDERREGEKPYLAIGWRFLKANGKYRYVWLLKGKLSQEEEEGETKKDKPNFQTTKLKGSFIERDFDDRPKFTQMLMNLHLQKLWEIIGLKGV